MSKIKNVGSTWNGWQSVILSFKELKCLKDGSAITVGAGLPYTPAMNYTIMTVGFADVSA